MDPIIIGSRIGIRLSFFGVEIESEGCPLKWRGKYCVGAEGEQQQIWIRSSMSFMEMVAMQTLFACDLCVKGCRSDLPVGLVLVGEGGSTQPESQADRA